jgi:hypothetical protein
LQNDYLDVKVILHLHSNLSHDSPGTLEDLISSAKKAKANVLMMSEHPSEDVDVLKQGLKGQNKDILFISGIEYKGFLIYPFSNLPFEKFEGKSKQDIINTVLDDGGLVFVSHPDEREEKDYNLAHYTGMEIYNTHSDFKNEKELSFFTEKKEKFKNFKKHPLEGFASIFDEPQEYIKRWDKLNLKRKVIGIAGNDSHSNVGFVLKKKAEGAILEDALGKEITKISPDKLFYIILLSGRESKDVIFSYKVDPYFISFSYVSTHILVREITKIDIFSALKKGRVYVSFDYLGNPDGFIFRVELGNRHIQIGGTTYLQKGLKLLGISPYPSQMQLFRNGKLEEEFYGTEFSYPVFKKGNYRLKVSLYLMRKYIPWIYTNNIYIR